MSDLKKVKTKTYRLIGRQHMGRDENGQLVNYKTGDKVELSDRQFEAFQNKFELVRDSEPLKEEPKEPEPLKDPVKVTEPKGVKPPVVK